MPFSFFRGPDLQFPSVWSDNIVFKCFSLVIQKFVSQMLGVVALGGIMSKVKNAGHEMAIVGNHAMSMLMPKFLLYS